MEVIYKSKKVSVYLVLLIIIYSPVMLLKYLTHDTLDWLITFLFLLSMSLVYLLLRRTNTDRRIPIATVLSELGLFCNSIYFYGILTVGSYYKPVKE